MIDGVAAALDLRAALNARVDAGNHVLADRPTIVSSRKTFLEAFAGRQGDRPRLNFGKLIAKIVRQ